jgi:hypothetical protein
MPDGRRLVFKTGAGGVLDAFAIQNADGSGPRRPHLPDRPAPQG